MGIDKDASLPESVLMAFVFYEGMVRHALLDNDEGFSKTQMMMLFGLAVQGSSSISQLSERLAVSREQASRAAADLESKGYLAKVRNDNNWRMVRLEPTEKTREVVERVRGHVMAFLNDHLSALSEDEQARLRNCSIEASIIMERLIERAEPCSKPETKDV